MELKNNTANAAVLPSVNLNLDSYAFYKSIAEEKLGSPVKTGTPIFRHLGDTQKLGEYDYINGDGITFLQPRQIYVGRLTSLIKAASNDDLLTGDFISYFMKNMNGTLVKYYVGAAQMFTNEVEIVFYALKLGIEEGNNHWALQFRGYQFAI